jgi:hypothetical protein
MKPVPRWFLLAGAVLATVHANAQVAAGALLPGQPPNAQLWWAGSSAAKIRPGQTPPARRDEAIRIRCARNETDAAQLIVRPAGALAGFVIEPAPLVGRDGAAIAPGQIEILEVGQVHIAQPTDRAGAPGPWPDPLFPISAPLDLAANANHAFWIRIHAPRDARPGIYRGELRLRARGWAAVAPLELTVYDFTLPDRMTCTTAFGFSPNNVFRYHRLQTEADKRAVLEKYWATFAAHHISPYNPAPLDPIRVRWPDARPPEGAVSPWLGLRMVTNETHSGAGALLIYDDRPDQNVTVTYEPLIPIPAKGLRVSAWHRTAVPGHRFMVSINHFDADRKWMSGRNNDITLRGSGAWQQIDELITGFPPGARFVQFHARATTWTDAGEGIGLVWFDDISMVDADTGDELVKGGDFEPQRRTEPVLPLDQLEVRLDFAAWDRAMDRAMSQYHFNSFQVHIPGIGGGTFHAISEPSLLGFAEDTPEYPVLFDSYCRQLEAHLEARGWLEAAFVYWFDEPSPDQYPFVQNGFDKLKRSCPGIARMLTEQVEPGLIGGPNIWCSITDAYDHERAEARRKFGEKFWWYVCTGPKAPYAGLFIDHPAPELRIWLWQTFQRNIEGILVWESTYWTSDAAYPDPQRPQNPYTDPMSWTSGYSTPAGDKRPWGNGDGRFLYPPIAAANADSAGPVLDGPVDSIRWEHLRDGLEDYEYLAMLRRILDADAGRIPTGLESEARQLLIVPASITASLTEFTADGEPIERHRDLVARMIERLGRSAGR